MKNIQELNTDVGKKNSTDISLKRVRDKIKSKGHEFKNKATDLRNREGIKNDNKSAMKKSFLAKAKSILLRR